MWYLQNKNRTNNHSKDWIIKNIEYQKRWRKEHKEEIKNYTKNYCLEHKKEHNIYNKNYIKKRYNSDINFKILLNIRNKINNSVRVNNKSQSSLKLLGCSIDYFKCYLQSKFTKGMTWDNHGRGWGNKGLKQWHIDHIKPCSSFDLSKPDEQQKCFHYSNLQPLWAKDNLAKGSKYKTVGDIHG